MRKKRKRQKDAARLRLRRAGVMGERGGAPFLRGSFRASSRPCPAPSAGNAPRPQSAAVPPRARRKKRRARGGFAAGTPFPALRHSMAGRHAAGRRSACSVPPALPHVRGRQGGRRCAEFERAGRQCGRRLFPRKTGARKQVYFVIFYFFLTNAAGCCTMIGKEKRCEREYGYAYGL